MEILAKNRAYLRGLGAKLKPSLNLGKSEVDDSFLHALDRALDAHELVKIKVLQNNEDSLDDIISLIKEKTKCGLVAITGKTILLYRSNKKNPQIVLPR